MNSPLSPYRITISSLLVLTCSLFHSLSAQVEIERQVIGSFGGSATLNQSAIWQYTAGEAVIETQQGENLVVTQGFHQPDSKGLLQFSVITELATCPTSSDGKARVIDIQGCSPPYEITWSTGETNVDSLDRLLPGIYFVTVSTEFCELTQEFEILSGPEENCILRFFNAFTPNGDGKSETWRIENIERPEYSTNQVEIFNRWGQSIYRADNYNNLDVVWNGEGKEGALLPAGTYFFVVEVRQVTHKGYIELIR